MLEKLGRLFVRSHALAGHPAVLDSAICVQMVNQVEGDYLEFGVFRGDRLAQAYETAAWVAKQTRAQKFHYVKKASAHNLETMRFFGFDSFEGLPKPGAIDVLAGQEAWFGQGGFNASMDQVTRLMPRKGMRDGRIKLVKGWFNESLTEETKKSLALTAASIVYVDCDYYESAVPVLEFVTDLLVDGSILIFDDWFVYRGRTDRGEQRAFAEWRERHQIQVNPFIQGTAMSFIVQR
jgi:O-methyltransferase